MQSLRSTGLRRLCLLTSASVAQVSPDTLLSTLSYSIRPFASSTIRWDQSARKLYHEIIEETEVKKRSLMGSVIVAPTKAMTPTSALFLGNLPFSTTESDLREIFSAYGPLNRIKMGTDRNGRPLGYAHINFELKEDAVKATGAHEESPMIIGDRLVRVGHAFPPPLREGGPATPRRAVKTRRDPSPIIFVADLPSDATSDDIREALNPLGDVVAVRISFNREGVSKGFAHADFKTTAEAEKVLDHYRYHPIRIRDQEVRLDRSTSADKAYPPSPRLYFTNWEGDVSSLRSHFRALSSQIVSIYIIKNLNPNTSKKSGYITFRHLDTATEALARFNDAQGLILAYSRPR